MAVTSKSIQNADQPKTDEPTAPEQRPKTDDKSEPAVKVDDWDGSTCVVPDSDPTPHTGRAVPPTRVCSAHTMRYLADGTPRDARTGQDAR